MQRFRIFLVYIGCAVTGISFGIATGNTAIGAGVWGVMVSIFAMVEYVTHHLNPK